MARKTRRLFKNKRKKLTLSPQLSRDIRPRSPIDIPLDDEPEPEPSDHRFKWCYPIAAAVFFLVLFVGTAVAWVIPWRPTHSDMEQRDLTPFPSLTWDSFVSGDYFDHINLWFADTFPGREIWVKLNADWQSLYGVSGAKLYGQVAKADEIPEVSHRETPEISVPDESEPTTPATTTTTTTTTASVTTSTTVGTTSRTAATTGDNDKWNGDNGTVDQGQTLNGILVMGNSAYEYYSFSQSTADDYVKAINQAAAKVKGKANLYDVVVPTSIGVMLPEDIRQKLNSSDQEKAIRYLYGSISADVRVVPILQVLRDHNDEYLYFHTDHHWTARGAYYAYAAFMQVKGQTPTALSAYETKAFTGFRGSFYAETQSKALREDVVTAYLPPCETSLVFTDTEGKKWDWNVIQDVSNWAARSKYNTFIGGDNPFTEITNKNKSDGSAVLVVKESFGNAFVPFLVEHYEKVYVVDYRYYDTMKLAKVVEKYHIGDVIFMNNIGATRSPSLVEDIADFVG